MPESGYSFEVLRPGAEFTLYRRRAPGKPSVLALAVTAPSSARSIGRLVHENSLASELDAAWAARPLALTRHDGRQMLLLEDAGGVPLDVILDRSRHEPPDPTRHLQLAAGLARAIGQIHLQGLIHKDIKPANVLVDSAGQVRLTGFGIASRQRIERQAPPPAIIAGTFAYMAPEQTGRMNRSMDARSDLYSLGVTLYELFAGTLPFNATEPMEWIHCHIARQPLPPSVHAPGLSPAIDGIVLKLLAKNPEDRYRTAKGVEADLRKCLARGAGHGVRTFALGEHDLGDSLLIPEKLYGRDAEIEALLAAFDRVIVQGSSEIVLLSGYSGIGKSSLINELHKTLVPRRGLFSSGKFDQYKRDIPYATLAQAFQGLVRELLNKSDAELARWRQALLEALGPDGQLMVNMIPELALVIGEQPSVVQLDAQAAQARFHRVFRSLLGVFATPEHPLVLFIDDLQWLDAATLELLERLVTRKEARHLMFIGAYRDDEVGDAHPLARTLAAIRSDGGAVCEIALGPLQVEHLAQLCADALGTGVARARPLAELVCEKTAGNPFFAVQFITALADEGLLVFDAGSATWQWDIAGMRAKGITDNVAHLMSAKLGRLPVRTQEALGALACLGNGAAIRTLALVRESTETDVQAALQDAVDAGLVLYAGGTFNFVHDRVQEAGYASIPRANRAHAHLRIGQVLLSLMSAAEVEEKIFEIVNQFERGASAIHQPAERASTAALYLMAGKRAKASSAYASARAYFASGLTLLGEGSWTHHQALAFELQRNCAECEIVCGEMAGAEARLAELALQAQGTIPQIEVACLAVLLYFTTGRNERAVEVALAILPRVGITWTPHPAEAEVRREYTEMHERLAGRRAEALIDMPVMGDPVCIATMAVLTELFPAAYAVDRHLLGLVLLRMTNLSLQHGNCESSSVAYSALNMVLGPQFGDYTTAYTLGQLACDLVDHRGMDRFKARVYSCFAAFTMPWIKHLPLCEPLMTHAFQVGSAIGDKAFAAYNSRNLITHLLASGVPLLQVQRETEQVIAFASGVELGLPTDRFIGQLDLVKKLRGIPTDPRPDDEAWAGQDVEPHPGLAMMVCYYWVFRLQERFFADDIGAALAAAGHVEGIRWAMRSSIEEAEYDFYAALSCAAAADSGPAEQRKGRLQALGVHHGRIAAWSENCPENFAHRKALVGAEIARLEGRRFDAQVLYEQAVRLARRHGFVQNEGLANELAGRFHAACELETAADAYLRNARICYEEWGALAKLKQFDARYPHLRERERVVSGSGIATIEKPVVQLDVETVGRASKTLSSVMILPSLLEKLMRLAVEHAGAERGLLILVHAGEPHVEAKALTGHGSVEVVVQSARVMPSDLPQSTLHYVLRTGQRVVLDDASAEGLHSQDEYVRSNQPRSVLCLPIFREEDVIGVLYLENNLTTRAFTADRVAVLDFLASQAAIWLENARLYSDLQRSETWLREAQYLSATGSFYWHVTTDEIAFSAQTYRLYELDPNEPITPALIAARYHPEDLPLLEEMIAIARGPATDLDYRLRMLMPDQSVKHFHLVAHATRDAHGEVEYIGAVQDVTQRHLAEEALGKARSELAHVARITTLGVLTASIAHEVNQPLLGIVTNASTCLRMLAAEPPNIEGARKTAQRSIRDGHRAADVIKRLRALFGQKGTITEMVDLNEAAREVLSLSSIELQRSRVVLQIDLAADLPPVLGDRVQLQQVMLNLLLNASDAMIDVHNRPRQLAIATALDEHDEVRLTVRDTGMGLAAEGMDRLFEAFYTTKAGGMGMGLSVSRSIIESHRGRLWASANDGPGATFSFSVPRGASMLLEGVAPGV